MNIEISLAEPNSFELIKKTVAEIYESTSPRAQFNWPAEKAELEIRESSVLWISASDGSCVSFICYRTNFMAFEVTLLGTHPEWQRRGLQRRVLEHLQRLAALQNKSIWLEVHSENKAAISLYRRLGFQQLRERTRYYSDGASALEMCWLAQDS